jgi:hypothetical protein
MQLRHHPLMSFRGMPNWPPIWAWRGGLENKHPRGEIGILKAVAKSNIEPAARCFLYIDYEGSSYIGCLPCDHSLCAQLVKVLEANRNRPISEIGSLDVSRLL